MIESEEGARAFVGDLASHEALDKLEQLGRELEAENARQNLVAKNSLPQLWQRHMADSAQLLRFVEPSQRQWLDLGSGAGFPGLVIAALRPAQRVVLIESRRKRVEWLLRMVDALELQNCTVEGTRMEQVETVKAGIISARAFAPLPRLLSLSARFSTTTTQWVLPKGRSAAQEVGELAAANRRMFHVEQSLTDPEAGIIVGRGQWRASK
ncbi:16S rRNA (guanine(527)-N(7))-methyltransferase RsmG [Qipengyuania sp. XHP0207]|uniref:16S rRNA (guanine(527)-N(7))-methyltransferase RsmG n=1 Tax=Qipengyuania sp. XHP0207 TaxID=3038078 RepID=UPI00241FB597|nr:16S rRNA (guanine(527)-N(7))-methyltransferase RsmG [Qipengyuania sp. XHP0207]MDG5748095.1 16S rRNA (guanine(527)-N(7))-methyltransferase RsmG [Qipengyuania sp. XHP0207]